MNEILVSGRYQQGKKKRKKTKRERETEEGRERLNECSVSKYSQMTADFDAEQLEQKRRCPVNKEF